MRDIAVELYRQEYNCSQCIVRAAEAVFGIPVSDSQMAMCSGIASGFGVGGLCSLLVAGIMVFGLLFPDEDTVKRLRIKLLARACETCGCTDCGPLLAKRVRGGGCELLVGEIADMIGDIILEEGCGYAQENRRNGRHL